MRVLGVDLGTRKVATALFEGDELLHAFAFEVSFHLARNQQLNTIGNHVCGQAVLHGVDSVWIEDVIVGNNRKYSIGLAQVQGAVMGMLPHIMDTRVVDNKTWKKHVVGNGNADKLAVRHYIDVTHPAYAPLCGDDQDLYDAACIGLYGGTVLERAADLHLQP